jgi:hypothetical protein
MLLTGPRQSSHISRLQNFSNCSGCSISLACPPCIPKVYAERERESSAPPNTMQLGQPDSFHAVLPIPGSSNLQWYHDEPTGISLTAAAMGIPARPRSTLASHWCMVKGVVFANSPRNCTMMNWKMTVLVRTAMNT